MSKPQIRPRPAVDAIASLASHLTSHRIPIQHRTERAPVLPEQARDDAEDEEIKIALQYVRPRSRKS